MPVTLQAVLLRFLDDWTVRPVGGAKRQVDVLLVSATNANLDESIAKGRFRSDLLFRLNTLEVTLPPLRERSDFAEIARHLIAKIDPSADLTQSAIDRLAELDWDGNIRELRNVLSRLSLAERGKSDRRGNGRIRCRTFVQRAAARARRRSAMGSKATCMRFSARMC